MKTVVVDATVLTPSAPDAPISLTVNASNVTLGAALLQHITGQIQILTSSRKLSSVELRYSTFGRKLLVVHPDTKHSRQFPEGRDFTIFMKQELFSFALISQSKKLNPRDNPRTNRSERRTAPMARELARYNVDIATLSETRFSEQSELEEVRPAGRAGDKSESGCRRVDRPSSRHLEDAGSPTASQETSSHFSNEPAQRLASLPVAAAAATIEENASMGNRWCQLRETVQATALAVRGHVRRQNQDWFDDNDAAISKHIAEKNRLHEVYVTRPMDDSKKPSTVVAALHNSGCARCGMPRRLARPRISKLTRIATNGRISFPRSKLSTVRQPKELLLFSAPTAVPKSPRRHKIFSDGPSISEASTTAPPPSPTPPSPVCLKWRPTPTSASHPLSMKPSGSYSSSLK
ncbi:hypothetical protein SprV_0100256500 [Sparganum proliferum]